jgi:hypothetical protein
MQKQNRSLFYRLRTLMVTTAPIALVALVATTSGVFTFREPATALDTPMQMSAASVALPTPAQGLSYGATKPEATPIQRPSNDGTGNFRVDCQWSHMNYDDPIVHPGRPGAAHLHSYFGNTGANAFSTGESLLNSGNSTCDGGTLNRSSYWLPSILATNSQPIAPISNMVYYKQGYQGLTRDKIVSVLPNGLQLVGGDPKASSHNPARQVHWSCSTESWRGRQASIPSCPPGETIKAEINFPQCWDGINLSSPDHVSHMAYGTWNVGCPATHPVGIPSISFNVVWKVPPGGNSGWRLSSDMYAGGAGGYSLHGDVILAWDPNTASLWLNNCVKQNADCHVGQISDTAALIFGSRNGDATTTSPPTTATTAPPTTATTAPTVTTAPPPSTTAPIPTTPPTTAAPTTSPSESCTNNRITNSGFESGLTGWIRGVVTTGLFPTPTRGSAHGRLLVEGSHSPSARGSASTCR